MQWTYQFEWDTLPDTLEPPLKWEKGQDSHGHSYAEIIDGTILHLNTSQWGDYIYYIQREEYWGGVWTCPSKYTIEFRVRVSTPTNGSAAHISCESSEKKITLRLLTEPDPHIECFDVSYDIDTTIFHIYRLTCDETYERVYVDNSPTPVITTLARSSPYARVIFGNTEAAGGNEGESYWDYIYWNDKDAFAPGEECPVPIPNFTHDAEPCP